PLDRALHRRALERELAEHLRLDEMIAQQRQHLVEIGGAERIDERGRLRRCVGCFRFDRRLLRTQRRETSEEKRGQRARHGEFHRVRQSYAVSPFTAISPRNCAPSNRIASTAAYAFARAAARSSASAVTPSTRPPAVTRWPPSIFVPA